MDTAFEVKRLWRGFWQLADPKIWVASTVPMLVGAVLAYGDTGNFPVLWFALSLAGIYFIEIGKNAVNEFVDFNTGVDVFVTPDKRTPFSGGKKTIVDRKLTFAEAVLIALGTFAAGCAVGMVIVFFREPYVLAVGLAGVFLSVFYSLPPLKLAYRGLGEVTVGLTFGPLILSGMYIAMARQFTWEVLVASLPIGFIIANVLWINQYPDYEADLKGSKKNLVVRLGKKRAVKGYAALFAGAYISLCAAAVVYGNPLWLLGLATIPLAVKAVKAAAKYYDDIPKLVEANIKTVQIYQLTGLFMVIAALTNKFF